MTVSISGRFQRNSLNYLLLTFFLALPVGCGGDDGLTGPPQGAGSVDLQLAMSVTNTAPPEGRTTTFTLVVRNNGPIEAVEVFVGDTLPDGLEYVSHTESQGSYSPDIGVWNVGSLEVGAEATLQLAARPASGTEGSTIIKQAGVFSEALHDLVPENNTTEVLLAIGPPLNQDGVYFSSDWGTATGTSPEATGDGGAWTDFYCTESTRARVMEVVAGAPFDWTATPNILQLTMDGENCGLLQNRTAIPAGADYYVRNYVMVLDATSNGTNHPYKTGWRGSNSIILWSLQERDPVARTYRPAIRVSPDRWIDSNISQAFGINFLGPDLPWGEWYRFEAKVEYVGDPALGRSRVFPRIYNAAGELIADENDYVHKESGTTLAESLADGAYYQHADIDGYLLGHIHWLAMGYEGPGGSQPSDQRYFFAGFEARGDTWPGPIN